MLEKIYKDLVKVIPSGKVARLDTSGTEERFFKCMDEFSDADVEMAFHGTSKKNVGSIVRNGFIGPGDMGYNKQNGNVYGPGVYATSKYSYAAKYGEDNAVMVLAILPGEQVAYKLGGCTDKHGRLTADSVRHNHITVLRSSAQVIPVFIIEKSDDEHVPYDELKFMIHPDEP